MRPFGGSRLHPGLGLSVIAVAVFLGVTPLPAQLAPTHEYEVTVLHPTGAGVTESAAVSINDAHETVGVMTLNGALQAVVWSGVGTNVRSLNLGVGHSSEAHSISGTRIGGTDWIPAANDSIRAVLWDAHGSSVVSMHPAGMADSSILGGDRDQFVGWQIGPGSASGQVKAALWTNPSASGVVDLNPAHLGFFVSIASAIDVARNQQVGAGQLVDPNNPGAGVQTHALLWNGSAAGATDLHPPGFTHSEATAVSDLQTVGLGVPAGATHAHALLWGSSGVIDLNPAGFTESQALGVRRGQQVGFASGPGTSNQPHAVLWLGTAASMIDLHRFVPAGFVGSVASDIDGEGNIVGWAITSTGRNQAVLWRRLPDLVSISFSGVFTTQGNGYSSLRITLDGPALSAGAGIDLASSRPDITRLPLASGGLPGTLVPSGSTTATAGIWFAPVATRTIVVITATFRGQTRFATMVVVPATLASVRFASSRVVGGNATTGTVTLDGPAPVGGALVQLSGSTLTASWPATVTIPEGATSVTFTIQTARPSTSLFITTLTASYAGVSRQATLEVIRVIPTPIPGF